MTVYTDSPTAKVTCCRGKDNDNVKLTITLNEAELGTIYSGLNLKWRELREAGLNYCAEEVNEIAEAVYRAQIEAGF